MKKIYFCLLLSVFFLINLYPQNKNITITFILNTSSLPEDSLVFITGGIAQLGNWNPAKFKMNYIGINKWSYEIKLTEPTSFEYKYTLGSWNREGAKADGLPLSNFKTEIHSDTIIINEVLFWTNRDKKNIQPSITGTVKYHPAFKGENILPRDVIVWLPPGYENTTKRYPVLYMHDGQNLFDKTTSAFGVEWNVDETMDSLIRFDIISPDIVVGIYNTSNRTSEYTPGDTGTAYMNFIVNELKPFVDSVYRTKPGREDTFTGGSSAGGLISFMLVWEHPEIFSKAICMSPALKISYIDYVAVVDSSENRDLIFYYIDNGGVGVEEKLQPGIDEMISKLKEKGYREGEDYFYLIDSDAEHFESAWARRFPEAVQKLFNTK